MSDLSCYFDWEGKFAPKKEILGVTAKETVKSPRPGSFIFFATELVFFVQIISSACE